MLREETVRRMGMANLGDAHYKNVCNPTGEEIVVLQGVVLLG
jgi:hypothetical protein